MPLNVRQEELQLFPPVTIDEPIRKQSFAGLSITYNTRLKTSWRCTTAPDGSKTMTVPALLKEAPEQITAALIAWALLKRPRLKKDRKQYQTHKKQLENSVWEYLASKGVRSKRRIVADPRKFLLGTHGTRYDLKTLFDELNEKHFQRGLQSYLRWGTPTSKTSYQSYGFDSSGTKFSLITIAGIYNHPNVPDFAIKGVLYHEMLHILIPPYKKNFRNVIHGAAFKKAERLNPYLDKWQTWEKKELHAIIRSPRKQKPKGKLWFF